MSIPALLPFVLGHTDNLSALPNQIGGYQIIKIPVDGPDLRLSSAQRQAAHERFPSSDEHISPTRFARLLNLANGVAYGGGMGMPEWVMLDCALLPAFFAGFMGPSGRLSFSDQSLINEGLVRVEEERSERRVLVERELNVPLGSLIEEEWFPLAEFCAIPRLAPDELVGYSLYSLNRGFGGRAKAFGLWLLHHLGYRRQVGVAQWSNPAAVKAHLRFGPLELLDPLTPSHTKAGETFIYRLTLPDRDTLEMRAVSTVMVGQGEGNVAYTNREWRSVYDHSWWLSKRSERRAPLFLYDLRGRGDELEALVGE